MAQHVPIAPRDESFRLREVLEGHEERLQGKSRVVQRPPEGRPGTFPRIPTGTPRNDPERLIQGGTLSRFDIVGQGLYLRFQLACRFAH